jgi:sec-independent protein translocase protein TatA
MPNIGPMELLVVAVIALIVLGPKKLPDAASSLGRGVRQFRDAVSSSTPSLEVPDEAPARPAPRATAEQEQPALAGAAASPEWA